MDEIIDGEIVGKTVRSQRITGLLLLGTQTKVNLK